MPKISIIIPIYQVEQYIAQCLDSVVNQNFRDIEIICVDDCGGDRPLSIVESYAAKDARIRIIKHTSNKGLARARNSGLDQARGDYVFFLDSDDYLLAEAFERLYDESQRSHSDVVFSRTKFVFDACESDRIVQRKLDMEKYFLFDSFSPLHVSLNNCCKVLSSLPCVAWGKLYSRSFLSGHKLKFIDRNVLHEDEGFHIKLFAACPLISMIEDEVFVYRLRRGSIMDEITRDSKRKKRQKHMRASLYDAFAYIWRNLSFCHALTLVASIQNHGIYECFFRVSSWCPYFIIWTDVDKLVKVFGVELWKCKTTKAGKMNVKIFKVPVYRKRICRNPINKD